MTHPIYAIGYARISDPSQLKGDGLENQIKAIERHIENNHWTLFPDGKVSREIFTGRKVEVAKRPKYNELIDLIKKNPNKIKYFVINRIDRSTRSGSEEYLLIKSQLASLGVELRDSQNIIQPISNTLEHLGISFDWSNKSPSRITEILLAEMGKEDVANILTRTVNTSFSRASLGFKLREANYGYKNVVILANDGKQKTIQLPHEQEAPQIIALFDKTVEGVLTEQEIVDHINSLGYKSRDRKLWNGKKGDKRIIGVKVGNKLTIKQMQKYRKNPIYCGVNIENWGKIQKKKIITKTQYKGLVSIEKFNQANKGKVYVEELPENKIKLFYDLNPEKILKRRQKFRKDYLFKNVVLCDVCKKPFLASPSTSKNKEKYSFYHCSRTHKYYGKPQSEVDKAMMTFLSKIKFSDKYHSILKKVLTHKHKQEQEKSLDTQIVINQRITGIQSELRETLTAIKKSNSELVKDEMERDFERLSMDLRQVQGERKKIELSYEEVTLFLEYSKNLMEHPIDMFLDISSYAEQMAIYKILFLEFPTYKEVLSGTPKISLFFKVSDENRDDKSLDVTPRRIELRFPG
ncbi:recombinase family protein [Candidatus Kaiserbacteria bacterium]|nr:MAG: recombinase family protein [Candidatus Kaiserbacteria bacterium]